MATKFSEIIKTATVIIDDVRDREQLSLNPAVFYHRYSGYVEAAMPLLSRPPELYMYIRNNTVYSGFAETSWVSTAESMETQAEVDTEKPKFELCSIVKIDSEGMMTPYKDFTYDAETGRITFGLQEEEGIEYDINFYNDGYVKFDLTPAQLRLFGLAISVVWNERFENDWLNIQPKIKDSSFKSVNEPGFISKLTERQLQYRQRFQDELRKYEQDVAYIGFVVRRKGLKDAMFDPNYSKTTYDLSIESNLITLEGSDGSESTIALPVYDGVEDP